MRFVVDVIRETSDGCLYLRRTQSFVRNRLVYDVRLNSIFDIKFLLSNFLEASSL